MRGSCRELDKAALGGGPFRGTESQGEGGDLLRILIAPAHRELLTERGSEYAWALSLAKELVARGHEVHLVAGSAPDQGATGGVHVNTVLPPVTGTTENAIRQTLRVVAFPWKNAQASRRLLRTMRFDVLHHFLPFG